MNTHAKDNSVSLSDFREKLRAQPAVGMAVAAAVLLAAVGIGWYVLSPTPIAGPTFPDKAFFSSDDGVTYFVDDGSLVAPFERSGKRVYQAAVFRCPGKAPFVGYLMKYSDSGKAALEALPRAERLGANPKSMSIRGSSLSVKKPQTELWVPLDGDHPAGGIINLTCPGGSGTPEQMTP